MPFQESSDSKHLPQTIPYIWKAQYLGIGTRFIIIKGYFIQLQFASSQRVCLGISRQKFPSHTEGTPSRSIHSAQSGQRFLLTIVHMFLHFNILCKGDIYTTEYTIERIAFISVPISSFCLWFVLLAPTNDGFESLAYGEQPIDRHNHWSKQRKFSSRFPSISNFLQYTTDHTTYSSFSYSGFVFWWHRRPVCTSPCSAHAQTYLVSQIRLGCRDIFPWSHLARGWWWLTDPWLFFFRIPTSSSSSVC